MNLSLLLNIVHFIVKIVLHFHSSRIITKKAVKEQYNAYKDSQRGKNISVWKTLGITRYESSREYRVAYCLMSKTTKITYKMYLIEIWKIIQLQTKIVIAWLRIYSLPFFIWFFLIYVTWYSCDRIRLISVGFILGIRPVVLTHLLYSLHTKYIEMWYYYCICTNWVFTTSFLKIFNGNSIMYSPESIRQPNHDIYII